MAYKPQYGQDDATVPVLVLEALALLALPRWGDAARRCVTWLLRIEVGVYEDEVGLVVRPRSTSAKRFNTALFDSSNPNRMNQVFIRELEARRVSA